ADGTDYVKRLKHPLKKPRVGFLPRMSDHPVDLEVAAMVSKAARRCEKLGWRVEEVTAPFPHRDARRAFTILWLTNAQRLLELYPAERHNEFDPNLVASAKSGQRYTLQDLVNAHAARRELAMAWNLMLEEYDFILSPTIAVQPFPVLQNAPMGA